MGNIEKNQTAKEQTYTMADLQVKQQTVDPVTTLLSLIAMSTPNLYKVMMTNEQASRAVLNAALANSDTAEQLANSSYDQQLATIARELPHIVSTVERYGFTRLKHSTLFSQKTTAMSDVVANALQQTSRVLSAPPAA